MCVRVSVCLCVGVGGCRGGAGERGGADRAEGEQYFEKWDRNFLFGIISDTLFCDLTDIALFLKRRGKTIKLKRKEEEGNEKLISQLFSVIVT